MPPAHPLGHVWSTKPLITLTGFGAKNTVRILAGCTPGSGASTTIRSSKNSMRIILEFRKHGLFKHTMISLQKKRGKSQLYYRDLTCLSDPCFFLSSRLPPPLAAVRSIHARAGGRAPPSILGNTAGTGSHTRAALGLVLHDRKITKKCVLFIAILGTPKRYKYWP